MSFRNTIAAQVESDKQHYQLMCEIGIDDKIEEIRRDKEWAGEFEISVFSDAYRSTVRLFSFSPHQIIREFTHDDPVSVVDILFVCENHFDLLLDEDEYCKLDTISMEKSPVSGFSPQDIDMIVKASNEKLDEMVKSPDKNLTYDEFKKHLNSEHASTNWFRYVGVLPSVMICPNCDRQMRLRVGKREDFYCPKCHNRRTARGNSILKLFRTKPSQIGKVLYHWFSHAGTQKAANESSIDRRTMGRYSLKPSSKGCQTPS